VVAKLAGGQVVAKLAGGQVVAKWWPSGGQVVAKLAGGQVVAKLAGGHHHGAKLRFLLVSQGAGRGLLHYGMTAVYVFLLAASIGCMLAYYGFLARLMT
jgi:hypothetical protein